MNERRARLKARLTDKRAEKMRLAADAQERLGLLNADVAIADVQKLEEVNSAQILNHAEHFNALVGEFKAVSAEVDKIEEELGIK